MEKSLPAAILKTFRAWAQHILQTGADDLDHGQLPVPDAVRQRLGDCVVVAFPLYFFMPGRLRRRH